MTIATTNRTDAEIQGEAIAELTWGSLIDGSPNVQPSDIAWAEREKAGRAAWKAPGVTVVDAGSRSDSEP